MTVVGIGASAGGLPALKSFFADVATDSGLSWVVVVHLDPEQESHLAELLQPHVPIPIEQVTETTRLEPDRAYVIPPNANLDSVDTHLRLQALEERRLERAPIDHFFRTLANTHDGDAIGVILTGTGSDGSLGLRDIKHRGGLTVVQDPDDAEYDGMARSAIATGAIDLVLPLVDIPARILEFVRTQPRVPTDPGDHHLDGDDEQDLHRIFTQVRSLTGRDFTGYKKSTVLRRIRRRMQVGHTEMLANYVARLRDDPAEVSALADDLLITVTSFFRDPEVFAVLEESVLPGLFAGKEPGDTVRAWVVGCATGEEAYSLAILLLEAAAQLDSPPRLQVFASDLHERSLATAREGLYPDSIASDVDPDRLRRWFRREPDGYRIRQQVRELVVFSPHDLLADPPFSQLDLVSCRNLLIYLEGQVQRDVVEVFHHALREDGVLILGDSEKPESGDLFAAVDKQRRIFRQRNVPAPEPRLPVFPVAPRGIPRQDPRPLPRGDGPAFGALHQRVVERHGPPRILVSADDRIVHLSEHAGRYLVHPGGEPTSSVVKLVREELRMGLRAALHHVRDADEPRQTSAQAVRFNGDVGWVTMDVRPAVESGLDDYVLVLFFEHADEAHVAEIAPESNTSEARTQGLRAELETTRRRLQSVVEEYETSQEELRASNEELQSSNEELRSTLEELETSREELQSINEELQTVNQENRHKVEELSQLSTDLQNLLAATDIATLFLDRQLRILRFTPRVTELFNVRSADRGRPLSDITHHLDYDGLASDAVSVLQRLVPIEREISGQDDEWYLTRVLPYRSHDDRIEGVVLTFVDISERKSAEQGLQRAKAGSEQARATLRRSEQRYRVLFESIQEGFCVLEAVLDEDGDVVDFRYVEANPAFEELIGRADAVGRTVRELEPLPGEDWIERFGRIASTGTAERFVQDVEEAGDRWFDIDAFRVGTADDGRVAALFRDVSARLRAERELQALTHELEDRVQRRTDQVKSLVSTLTMAEQQERERLSQRLHDDIQQLLYGVQMQVTMARDQADAQDMDDAREACDQALVHMEEAIRQTRQLSVDLNPLIPDGTGLVEAVEWLGSYMQELHGLKVQIHRSVEAEVHPSPLRTLVFQVVRELLFNVAKHSGADHAVVTLDEEDGDVVIAVTDDGRGFDPDDVDEVIAGGLGLASSRQRLRLQGSSLDVTSDPGSGTEAVIRVPTG